MFLNCADNSRWISGNNHIIGDFSVNHAARSNYHIISNMRSH